MQRHNPVGKKLAEPDCSIRDTLQTRQVICLVVLPFVTGYFLSYYFRNVNAVLSQRLTSELSITAAELGVVTSAYFLMAALAQLPFGWALDRFGPRLVQSASLVSAAFGAALFAVASDVTTLFLARALIGLGVASALMAGLKAIAMICPPARIGQFNGIYIGIGALGAVTASMPTEQLLQTIHWRTLFLILAGASLAAAVLIAVLVPRAIAGASADPTGQPSLGYREIVTDPYFWRLAPLSATAIGGAWALQGLWSAPWLRDVALATPPAVAQSLLVMAVTLSVGAVSFGIILQRLTKLGIAPAGSMTCAAVVYIVAEIGLALSWPVPSLLLWSVVSLFAAATVLTYTMSALHFPKSSVGRANSAFNLLHFGAAFGIQSIFGAIVAQWPRDSLGHYPPEAYKAAFLSLVVVQLAALIWFLRPIAKAAGGQWSRAATRTLLPQAIAVVLLLFVGYQCLAQIQDPNVIVRPVAAKLHLHGQAGEAVADPMAVMEARMAGLEARLARQDRDIERLASGLRQRLPHEAETHRRLERTEDAIVILEDGIALLLSRLDHLGPPGR